MARVVKKPEERKDELLNIAIKLFLLKGYENTSVKDIYIEANGSFGMFYHHFNSKEEIFVAAMDKIANQFIEKMSGVLLDEKMSYEKRWGIAVGHYLEFLESRDKASGNERGEFDVSVFRALSLKVLSESIQPIQLFLEEGVSKRIIHVEDIHQTAVFIVYGIYGIIREERLWISSNKNALFVLSKLSGLIAKVLDTDIAIFDFNRLEKNAEE